MTEICSTEEKNNLSMSLEIVSVNESAQSDV